MPNHSFHLTDALQSFKYIMHAHTQTQAHVGSSFFIDIVSGHSFNVPEERVVFKGVIRSPGSPISLFLSGVFLDKRLTVKPVSHDAKIRGHKTSSGDVYVRR
ncbi:hypothetical protein NP493_409g07031 [Ridgeia piscesae]|uniref:Uncharacterized protein n=1 Tax=Ridgeia piscesae TaxID=27915 RepID=A0AAD9L236_RIDPI|nr:hypothetical protein NP493_409g07031 [Ridgeia piscesae]